MSSVTTQIVGNGGGSDDRLKAKGRIFDCLEDILMANETAIVLPPGRDLSQMHPIVLVEPKIEIKVDVNEAGEAIGGATPQQQRFIENLLQVPEVAARVSHKKSKSNGSNHSVNGSVSPHSQCSNDSVSSARRHHHGHHRHHTSGSHGHHSDKENNAPASGQGQVGLETVAEDPEAHEHRHHNHHHHTHHHHRHGHTSSNSSNHHHHHHHHHHNHSSEHTHSGHHKQHSTSTSAQNGSVVSTVEGSVAAKPEQVLRKYIIKKITIRKQDGSTKKIVIKKPVDEPNAPVKLTQVDEARDGVYWNGHVMCGGQSSDRSVVCGDLHVWRGLV